MYKRRNINTRPRVRQDKDVYESPHPYRSFGYYVLGGMDVTGEHLDVSHPVSYDDVKDIEANCDVDALSDPTVGFFEVAEQLGVNAAEAVEEAKSDQ